MSNVRIALLGDSTIDNHAYVPKDHTVTDYVWSACGEVPTYCYANDGAIMSSIHRQLKAVSKESTHMVVSVAGNDLLGLKRTVYSAKVEDMEVALHYLSSVVDAFREHYEQMAYEVIEFCRAHDIDIAFCTVYNGNAAAFDEQALNEIALKPFNDIIRTTCFETGAALIDSVTIFRSPFDFANPIEPSAQGGYRFAQAVKAFVGHEWPTEDHDLEISRAVFSGPIEVPEGMTFPEKDWSTHRWTGSYEPLADDLEGDPMFGGWPGFLGNSATERSK